MNRPESELVDGIYPEMIEPKQATDHPIPYDVMRDAERVLRVYGIPRNPTNVEPIARAILAERQRAAEIARELPLSELLNCSPGLAGKELWRTGAVVQAEAIANAILTQGDKQ